MHADEEEFLLEQGSLQDALWGINIYPDSPREKWLEFDSMLNIRPRQNIVLEELKILSCKRKLLKLLMN